MIYGIGIDFNWKGHYCHEQFYINHTTRPSLHNLLESAKSHRHLDSQRWRLHSCKRSLYETLRDATATGDRKIIC